MPRSRKIAQNEKGVTVTYEDTQEPGHHAASASADWCVCTIPLTILSQIEINVGAPMQAAIEAVPYASSVKVGLQFKRRFWEEDDADLRRHQLHRPADHPDLLSEHRLQHRPAKACCLAPTPGTGRIPTSSRPCRRRSGSSARSNTARRSIRNTRTEFENGIAVAWHRVPFTLGCAGDWTEEASKEHYDNLCQIDGRIVLAGEHASYIPAWMEGAILSSLDAITRLHQRVLAGDALHDVQRSVRDAIARGYRHDPPIRTASGLFCAALWHRRQLRAPLADSAGADPQRGDTFSEQTGEALYANVCQACHMEGAGRRRRRPTRRSPRTRIWKPAATRHHRAAWPEGMPPVGQMMSDEQVAAVVNYVRTFRQHLHGSRDINPDYSPAYGVPGAAAALVTVGGPGRRPRRPARR